MVLCIENAKESTKNTVKMNKFSKVAGYKSNMQNSVLFLYRGNKPKVKLRKQVHFQ